MASSKGFVNGTYRHWHTVCHLDPPTGFNAGEWWLGLKMARAAGARPLPLTAKNGQAFTFNLIDNILELLHTVDQRASGNISISDKITNPATRNRYVVSSLIEEAITSSQLEGASTTRKDAKEMIR